MHASAERVQAALRAAGLDAQVVETEGSARTAEEAAAAVGTRVGQIVKSLVFVAGDEPLLVLTSGANRVDPSRLEAVAGAPVRRAPADVVRSATGYPIGGVAPLGHPRPLRVLCDRDLLAYDEVWAAAGTPNAVFPVASGDLVRVTGATVVDVAATP